MPRSRVTEMPQKPSPRGPPSVRTSSANSDPAHHRMRMDRSLKPVEGRSPRGAQSDPLHQKKLGTRIADLESQLGQAQDELKSLKTQLVSVKAPKKAAQEQLEKKSKKIREKRSTTIQSQGSNEASDDLDQETDVFEVPIEKLSVKPEIQSADANDPKPESVCLSPAKPEKGDVSEPRNIEISMLKTSLDERDKELEVLRHENESLKGQLDNELSKILSAESAIEELRLKLKKADQDMEKSKTDAAQVNAKLEATEKAKQDLEAEMKRMRVQTEQWRKAADAAASVLAGEMETNGRRISERCGSMDKHYGSSGFEPVGGYDAGYMGSPGLVIDDPDDVFGSGKRRGSSMKMFGDLWKKKGHK